MSKWEETVGEGFGTGRQKGKSREHPVRNENDGTIGGKHVEHWDGSQDAVITPTTVASRSRVKED